MIGAPGVASSIGTLGTGETSDTLGMLSATSDTTSQETAPARGTMKPVIEEGIFVQDPIPNGAISSPEEINSTDSAGSTRAVQVVAGVEKALKKEKTKEDIANLIKEAKSEPLEKMKPFTIDDDDEDDPVITKETINLDFVNETYLANSTNVESLLTQLTTAKETGSAAASTAEDGSAHTVPTTSPIPFILSVEKKPAAIASVSPQAPLVGAVGEPAKTAIKTSEV